MNKIAENIAHIRQHIPEGISLLCVSKFHPAEAIVEAYETGERDFGESRVQELLDKHAQLPQDIRWHFIGHLQTNKVKSIVPFVYLIHSVDSIHLMECIEKEAAKIDRQIHILLEVHVAKEESKTGFTPESLPKNFDEYPHIVVDGIMGMATQTEDEEEIRRCFRNIHAAGRLLEIEHPIVSMGMSNDYMLAIEEGSTLVRIGSTIFGERHY